MVQNEIRHVTIVLKKMAHKKNRKTKLLTKKEQAEKNIFSKIISNVSKFEFFYGWFRIAKILPHISMTLFSFVRARVYLYVCFLFFACRLSQCRMLIIDIQYNDPHSVHYIQTKCICSVIKYGRTFRCLRAFISRMLQNLRQLFGTAHV